jgi:hemerythrin
MGGIHEVNQVCRDRFIAVETNLRDIEGKDFKAHERIHERIDMTKDELDKKIDSVKEKVSDQAVIIGKIIAYAAGAAFAGGALSRFIMK